MATQKKEKQKKNVKKDDMEEKLTSLEDQLRRSVADFQNLERRVAEERKQLIKYANKELLQKLLPAFDTLFLAEKHVEDEGVKYTVKNIKDTFESIGVTKIETEGKVFDPESMDCIETVEGEEGKVIEEVRPGFMLYDKILRPAAVKVGKEKNN